MDKIKEFTSKHWIIFTVIIVVVIRILISWNLPNFYLLNLRYDDKLMINQFKALNEGNYLGKYNDTTLVKGIIFPIFLYLTNLCGSHYGIILTIMYIIACIYFVYSLRKIIKYKPMMLAICIILLLNPISYSSELFQRLYRNALTVLEMLFFFGTVINIISSSKGNIIRYIFLGITTGVMLLTRDDNIWIIAVYVMLVIYKLYKSFKAKTVFELIIPMVITTIILNIVCYINYKHYGIYTYNELNNSNFKKAYIKILQIKDDEKKEKVAIPKSTMYKLSENSEVFNISRKSIDLKYKYLSNREGEIYNGNMLWYLRFWIYQENNITTGEEANKYWKELSDEIDQLFEEGKLEKEFAIPSININTPTIEDIKRLPQNLIDAIVYTTTYKNVKTFKEKDIKPKGTYDSTIDAYIITYDDYHNAENIIEYNDFGIEMIRIIYKYFTIIFSIVSIIVYIKNIKIKDKLNLVLHMTVIIYTAIICGVVYTNTTAFDATRYCYLGNVYIMQNLFILLNLIRIYDKKKGSKNDISCNTGI